MSNKTNPEDEPTHVSHFVKEFLKGLEGSNWPSEFGSYKEAKWWQKDVTFLKQKSESKPKPELKST